jgi:ABC-type multidrug transport system fused ATPase/permease subunit
MTTSEEASGQRNGQKLDDIVRDADDYYNYLKKKHASETRLDVLVVSLVVWFASFAVIGLSAFALYGRENYLLLISFLIAIVIAAAAGVFTYFIRRSRGFKFAELGALLGKMKQGGASSEDGLRLMDAMHQAAVVVKKRRMDSAFEYGLLTFAIVVIVGMNSAVASLAGIVAYLYFRFEALREYERGEERYEDSKKALLQSL